MGLFGAESEDVQKALLKVQSAMALSQGLSQIKDLSKVTDELKSSFKGLISTTAQKTAATNSDTTAAGANAAANTAQASATNASSVASKAAAISMKVLRGAIISLGIPALVLGLISLVQNFGAIKDAVLNLMPGLKGFSDTIGGLVQKVTDFFGITSKANRELESLTKGTTARNESIETQIKLLSAQGGKEKEIFELKKKQTQQELQDLIASDRLDGKTTEERQKRRKELLNNLTFETAAYNKKEADEAKAAADKQAAEAKTRAEKAKDQKEKDDADKKEADQKIKDDKKAADEKTAAEDKEFQKRLNEVLTETRLAAIKDENDRVREELLANQKQELADLAADTNLREEQKLALETQLKIRNKQELDALDQSFAEADAIKKLDELDAQMQESQADLDMQKTLLDQKKALLDQFYAEGKITREQYFEGQKEIESAEIKLTQEKYDLQISRAKEASMVLGQLSELAGKQTAAGKALGIASALTNTYVGVTEALSAKSVLPSPFDVVAKVANVATILASGLKAVKAITAVQVPGGGGGGGAVSAPNISATAPGVGSQVPTIGSSPVTALGTMMQNQTPIKAYVVESEVTGTQKRVADIERRAGF
jgi:phage-related minor tail protein